MNTRSRKAEKEKTAEYTRGSGAAYMEAAELCREKASFYFLNHKDEAAAAIRELVGHFLRCAGQCHVDEDMP